jgi:type II secretory pathway component HofQ
MVRAVAVLVALTSVAQADDLCRPGRRAGRAIDLDLEDAPVTDVLQLLSDVAKLNLVVPDTVKGKVTVHLRGVPWNRAACAIAKMNDFTIDEDGPILVVRPR